MSPVAGAPGDVLKNGSLPTTLVASLLVLAACACSSTSRKRAADDGPIARVATGDGLTLAFDTRVGRVTGFGTSGLEATLAESGATVGVSVADHRGTPLLDAAHTPVSEHARDGDGLRLVREDAASGLRVIEEWRAHPRHIELLATLVDTRATDGPRQGRALEACLEVPVDLVGKSWFGHLHQRQVIEPGGHYQTVLVESLDIGHYSATGFGSHLKTSLPINLHGLNAVGDDAAGLAIGAHPASPGAYHVSYEAPVQGGEGAPAALRACFHLGIHPEHVTRPDRTSLRLVFLATDEPGWGLRSALDEYLTIFAEHARGQAAQEPGMTVGGSYRFDHYPAPERFHITNAWNAFYPQGPEHGVANLLYLWPTGYVDRGVRLRADPTPGPCAECDRSMDAQVNACLALYRDYEDGAVRFPETCADTWGLHGCRKSAVLPTEEKRYGPLRIRRAFYHLVPEKVVAPTDLVLRLFGKFAMYEPFSASILRGADGRFEGALSDSHAVMEVPRTQGIYTCYINGINPDPGVAASRPKAAESELPPVELGNFGALNLEIARRATGGYGADYVHRDQSGVMQRYDGVALDTVGAYLRPDFHEEMVRVASHPLAYDPETGRPVALEHLTLVAFIDELRRVLPREASIAINGYPISGALGRGVDSFVRELARRYRKLPGDERPRHYYELYDEDEGTRLRRIFRTRMVAYQRPITFWARFLLTEERARERGLDPAAMLLADAARYLPMYTAKGIYVYIQRTGIPGRERFLGAPQDPALMALYEKHLDTVHALVRAGWQPVPHARADEAQAQAQAITPAISIDRFGRGHFTLYNTSPEERSVTVRIEWARIVRAGGLARIRDFATGAAIGFRVSKDGVATTEAITVPGHGVRVIVASPETSPVDGDDGDG